MKLVDRLRVVQEKIATAAMQAGRHAADINLVVVSKFQSLADICTLYDAGVRDFGENFVQELSHKAQALAQSGRQARWHFIGQLQRNKLRRLTPHTHLIHSLGSMSHAQAWAKQLQQDQQQNVLLQVNLSEHAAKYGVLPADLPDLIEYVLSCSPRLKLRGLMTMPPVEHDAESYFLELQKLRLKLPQDLVEPHTWVLSMGMSDDFDVAIRCGANMVRVGQAIFGARSTSSRSFV